jgi:hypothetical protein
LIGEENNITNFFTASYLVNYFQKDLEISNFLYYIYLRNAASVLVIAWPRLSGLRRRKINYAA